jgi:hypothetical protein
MQCATQQKLNANPTAGYIRNFHHQRNPYISIKKSTDISTGALL